MCETLMNLADLETSMGSDVNSICELYRQAADVAAEAGLAKQRAFALRDMALTYAENGRAEDEGEMMRVNTAAAVVAAGWARSHYLCVFEVGSKVTTILYGTRLKHFLRGIQSQTSSFRGNLFLKIMDMVFYFYLK